MRTNIYGEDTRVGSTFCSAAKAMQYIHRGCLGYLAYVVDTRVEGKKSVSDMLVVKEFLDVFTEELHSLPPVRHVKFKVNLIPGVAPIAKAPYRLVPPGMPELSSQL